MTHRYALLLSLLSLGLGSCKSSEKAVFRAVRSNNSVTIGRLPHLQALVDQGPLQATEGALPDDASRLFRQELAFHTAESTADTITSDTVAFGYAKLIVTQATVQRTGRMLQGFQVLTLMTPSVLGVPLEWYRTNLKAEVQIINSKGEVLGTYAGEGHSKVRVAMYHGYSQTSAHRVSDVQALRLALDQIRPQLEADADALRQQLVSAGPVEESTGQSAGVN